MDLVPVQRLFTDRERTWRVVFLLAGHTPANAKGHELFRPSPLMRELRQLAGMSADRETREFNKPSDGSNKTRKEPVPYSPEQLDKLKDIAFSPRGQEIVAKYLREVFAELPNLIRQQVEAWDCHSIDDFDEYMSENMVSPHAGEKLLFMLMRDMPKQERLQIESTILKRLDIKLLPAVSKRQLP